MPTYLVLMKLTEHGVRNILNAPGRIEEAIRAFEAVGGPRLDLHYVMDWELWLRIALRSSQLDVVLMHNTVQIDAFSAGYEWQGRTLVFTPEPGWQPDQMYRITVKYRGQVLPPGWTFTTRGLRNSVTDPCILFLTSNTARRRGSR